MDKDLKELKSLGDHEIAFEGIKWFIIVKSYSKEIVYMGLPMVMAQMMPKSE